MKFADALHIVQYGITFQTLRDTMLHEYDGKASKMIPALTRSQVHLLLRAFIDGKDGFVNHESPDGIAGILILCEFAPDNQ